MNADTPTTSPACRTCGGPTIGWGKDKHGNPRRYCKGCKKSFGIIPARPLGAMRISPEQATLCLSLLTEGSSIRSTERITGVHRDTIMRLLVVAGAKAETALNTLVRGVEVKDVQADEIWGFVAMKEKTKNRKQIDDPQIGDAYTFVGIERTSKLVLAHHIGRRTSEDANVFAAKLSTAVNGDRFQMSTDGFEGYPEALENHLGAQIDYAMIIKSFSGNGLDGERRYSPPSIISTEKRAISGNPEEDRICTSHVERQNLTMRMQLRRLTRLTNGFSKKWKNLKAALALHFWNYNFCWMHSSIRMTPAMKAGISKKPLRVADLIAA
jgi:IS1 family transposase/transposase-like protein